ncbi:MAG TPA: hypothetical protein VMW15_00015 [Terracidiphilus sp.]|nr:hypothetical protein [Terracidiphilus sp.]
MVAVLPEAARPVRLVATPGRVAGAKVTVPERSEVAVEICVASRGAGWQTVWGEQGWGNWAVSGCWGVFQDGSDIGC